MFVSCGAYFNAAYANCRRHPERFPDAYEVLAKTFQAMLPLFEAALTCIGVNNAIPIQYDPGNLWETETDWAARTGNDSDDCDYEDRKFIEPPLRGKFRAPRKTTPISLRGRTLQVITKIATMNFTSERTGAEEPITLTTAADLKMTNPKDFRLGVERTLLTTSEAAEVNNWRECQDAYIPREEGVTYYRDFGEMLQEPTIFVEANAQGEEVVVFKVLSYKFTSHQVVAVVGVLGAEVIVTKPTELTSIDPALLRKTKTPVTPPVPRAFEGCPTSRRLLAAEDLVPLAPEELVRMETWQKGGNSGYGPAHSSDLKVDPGSYNNTKTVTLYPHDAEIVTLRRSTKITTTTQLVAVVDDGAPKMKYDGKFKRVAAA